MKNSKPNTIPPIHNVYRSNFIPEIKSLSRLLKKYNYIGMDTEFPGTVFSANLNSYKAIKSNVDSLKLIQVGITLSDKFGNKPEECSTWQFNLQFSLKLDQHSIDSINMLTASGIDFNEFEKEGIPHDLFAEYLLNSGLVINDDLKWICFHGVYDFAYLLHTITNMALPETEAAFFEDLKLYFPCFYDIRYLIRFNESLKGSLSKLAQDINVKRFGTQHQAGSDSLLTLDVFFKLLQEEFLLEEYIINESNLLFGITPDDFIHSDQSTNGSFANYMKMKSNGNVAGQNNITSMNYDYNYFPMNSMNTIGSMNQMNIPNVNSQGMQYNYMRNNNSNYYMQGNNYYSYNMGMQYPVMGANEGSSNSVTDSLRKKPKKGSTDE